MFSQGWSCKGSVAEAVDLNFFMAPIPSLVSPETDTSMDDKKYSTAVAPNEPMDGISVLNDDRESQTRRSASESEEIPRKKSSKSHSKRRHSKRRSRDVK